MENILPVFKALSEGTRLKILHLLKEGDLCVCDIAESLGMTQPNISFHLSMLKDAGLIKDEKNGRWIHYSLDESDMFKRYILYGVFDQIKEAPPAGHVKRRKC